MIRSGCLGTLLLLLVHVGYAQEATPPRLVELGRTVQGRPINAIVYGSGPKRVLVLGGMHGNERSTAYLAKALSCFLAYEAPPADLTLVIVPEVNPDGLAIGRRVNANGVDLNRNFPAHSWQADYRDQNHYPGLRPATEPETRAIIQLLDWYRPTLVITFHAALGCVNWDGPAAEIARSLSTASGYSLCAYLGYETPGSFRQYVGLDQNIPSIAIELADADVPEAHWVRILSGWLSEMLSTQSKSRGRNS